MIIKILLNLIVFSIFFFIIAYIVKSNSKNTIKLLKILLSTFVLWIVFFITDYNLTKNQKLPIFSTKLFGIFSYQDGGTVEYIGFGYKVIDFHKLVYGLEGWENEYKYEQIYICPWTTSYNKAFELLEYEYLENKR